MKKTFVTLLALAAASAASAADYTTTTGQWGAGSQEVYGWSDKLSGPGYLSSNSALPAEVELTAISLISKDNTTGLADGSKLALFTFTSDGTVGSFVGISDNVVTAPETAGAITYTFTGVTLNTTTQYRFLLVDDTTTAANFSSEAGANNLTAYQAVSGSLNLETENLGASFPQGSGVFLNNTAGAGGWHNRKLDVTYKTTDLPVPEPATATLSLLALAGLAARRRRK